MSTTKFAVAGATIASPWPLTFFGTRAQIGLLAVLGAYFLVWPLWRLGFPIEIDVNEGFNSYLADAAMGSGPLYPAADTLLLNNYPPLSFYLTGALARLSDIDALYIGRALSLVAVIALGALVGATVRLLGGGRAGAAVGGLWFVAVMARSYVRYVGMDDPQLFAQALMMAALVWFLVSEKHGRTLVPAVLLMVVAGFFKHNIIAVPVTALGFVALNDLRRAAWPAAAGAAAAALGLAACVAVWGDAFLANFLTQRGHEWMRAAAAIGRAQFLLPALLLWGVWIAAERKSAAARFTMLFVAVSFVAFVLQAAGDGVDDNAQFDLVIATATGLGMAFDRAGATRFGQRYGAVPAQAVVVVLVALRLLATLRIEPALVLSDPAYRAQYAANAAVVRSDAARVAAISGPVACDAALVCRLAGKPRAFDWFRVLTLAKRGAAAGLGVDGLIRAHGLTRVEADPREGIAVLERSLAGTR